MKRIIFILAILLATLFLIVQAESVVFISGTSGGAACSWSVVWDAETVSGDSTWSDYNPADKNNRVILDNTDTTGGGTQIRVTLRANSGAAADINGASIGLRSGNTADFTSTPTNITFGGGNDTVTISAGADEVSDDITFSMATGSNYLVALATNGAMQYLDLTSSAYTKNTSADETMTVTTTGYTVHNYIEFLVQVEACN